MVAKNCSQRIKVNCYKNKSIFNVHGVFQGLIIEIEVLTKGNYASQSSVSRPMSFKPVFIFGCPRSGTTMLASQLAASEAAIALPEMPYVSWLVNVSMATEYDQRSVYEKLTNNFFYKAMGLSYSFHQFREAALEQDSRERVFAIIRAYIEQNKEKLNKRDLRYWVEHSPISRESSHILAAAFPEAKFIHIVRDPRSVFSSMTKLPAWNTHDPLMFAKFWANAVSRSYLYAKENPDRVIEVRYEDYLTDSPGQLQRLCDFVGVERTEEMLQGGGVLLPQFTQSQHLLTKGPTRPRDKEEWREKIPCRYAEVISAYCLPWMISYGYLDQGDEFKAASRSERRIFALKQLLKTPPSKLARLVQQRV